MPYSLKQLQELSEENQECTTKIEAEWGPQSRKDQFVYVKIQATRSEKQIELQRRNRLPAGVQRAARAERHLQPRPAVR